MPGARKSLACQLQASSGRRAAEGEYLQEFAVCLQLAEIARTFFAFLRYRNVIRSLCCDECGSYRREACI